MKTRHLLWSALTGAILLTACHKLPSDRVVIDGELQFAPDTLLLIDLTTQQKDVLDCDTLLLEQGKFHGELITDEPTRMLLIGPDVLRQMEDVVISLPAVPGEKITIKGNADDYIVSGSAFYRQYGEALTALSLVGLQDPTMVEDMLCHYIVAHGDEETALVLLADFLCEINAERALQAAEALSGEVKGGRFSKYLSEALRQARREVELEKATEALQASGTAAPDFTLYDLSGKPLTLSSLRGKYVVLDFWGSWCRWCIKGIPDMKAMYAKYSKHLEIVGVDCRDSQETWREAVKQYELPWLHVYNPDESTLLEDYAIQGFPTKVILAPDGTIVRVIVGEDPAFYTLVDSLMQAR